MVTTERPGGVRGLVDKENGLISREIFVNEDLYKQELERVFARTWLFIGHTSQVPNPNDFFISRMGEESVILTRDRQGEIHVLLNTCMHRGMKVCRYDEGNTPVFSCPYHGWSYSTDGNLVSVPGELIGVPQFATAYHGELKKEEWGLISVPKLKVYKGSVWACWDKDAPEWEEWMGGMIPYLDVVFESIEGDPDGRVVFGGVHKWIGPHNWKFGAENFIGDGYHGTPSHRSAQLTSAQGITAGQIPTVTRKTGTENLSISFPNGHGVLSSVAPEEWKSRDSLTLESHDDPEIDAYFKNAYEERFRRLGGFGPQRSGGVPSTLFPNMSFAAAVPHTIAVWHPAGPTMSETWRWYLVDKNAPPKVRDAWRREHIQFSGPVGRVEKDDEENWGYATEASQGTIARRYRYNYAQGLGHEGMHDALPGAQVFGRAITRGGVLGQTVANEQNQRGFYYRWAEMMDAKNWDELREWDAAKG